MIPDAKRLPIALLTMRLGVFVVMALWSVDKILNPDHAAAVFDTYYWLGGIGPGALAGIGVAQLLIEIGFAAGLFRTVTYGFVLVTHLVSTLASWPGYIEPFENLLFFAAWPMLAACFALFLLRDEDTLWSLDARRSEGSERLREADAVPVPG